MRQKKPSLASNVRLQTVHKVANTNGASHPLFTPRQTSRARSVKQTRGRQWPQLNQLNLHEIWTNPTASGIARRQANRAWIFRQHTTAQTAAIPARPRNWKMV